MADLIFSCGSDLPADLIGNAAAVTRFLADALPHVPAGEAISELGANGLYLILTGVENTLKQALTSL